MVDWLSLLIPFAYLGVLLGTLATFSSLYRKRKAAKARSLEPWFPPSLPRNVYLSLLHLEPSEATGNKPVPDSVLKAALLRRATVAIKRLIEVRNAEPALQQLLQRGSVGDEIWQRFRRGKEIIEAECRDIAQEANAFSPNWGQHIFQSANEMNQNLLLRTLIDEKQSQVESDRQWWEKRKAAIKADFMKELESKSEKGAKPAAAKLEVGKNEAAAPSNMNTAETEKTTGAGIDKPPSSDEDTVLVEVKKESKPHHHGGKKKKGKR